MRGSNPIAINLSTEEHPTPGMAAQDSYNEMLKKVLESDQANLDRLASELREEEEEQKTQIQAAERQGKKITEAENLETEEMRKKAQNEQNEDDARSGLNSKREERREKEKEDAPPKSKRQDNDAGKEQPKKKHQEGEGESSESPQKSKATYVVEEDLEEKIAKALKKFKSEELDTDDLRLKGSPLSPEIMEETIPYSMKLQSCQPSTEKEIPEITHLDSRPPWGYLAYQTLSYAGSFQPRSRAPPRGGTTS
ncbi:uncharacterized protein LOC126668398 [Mercurialis annua]|uniref:uncharacterized protein LOC126668398 n=1 Tax=Mercurialis annua TaxID=3986 RepID=UPI0021609EB5|nr:uncharacterized protein LOC126668398 [Mercurialis annua]